MDLPNVAEHDISCLNIGMVKALERIQLHPPTQKAARFYLKSLRGKFNINGNQEEDLAEEGPRGGGP